ncbi:MAG: DUF1592 domain-containing protein, partial [Pirellulaceae bacterium]|nr:DUF1592 domain-containing protein [Pirellulaceae bacterium]
RSSEPEPNVKRGKKKGKTPPPEDPNFPKVVIDWVEFVGPIFDQWPPAHHRQLLFEQGDLTDDEYALRVIEKFADRAFRGPADAAEVAAAHEFFKKIRPRQESIEAALRETLALILISPRFLYLVEPASPDRSLTNHQIATRLSYFLWNSMPDPTLGELADAGNLNDPKVVNEQVERMLADPKSWRFVKSFTNEWLDLDGLQRVAVNPEYYPDFNNDLKAEMVRETQHFFAEVLFKDLSALNFIEADFAMLNGPLARHYGVEGPRGGGFERVALDGEQRRGGLLSQASFLLANSTGEDSHPVKRGVWIRSRLLDNPPPPPPPNVPPLEAENPNFAKLPLKEQLKAHRNHAACSSCHRGIDPWGVALEQFDAVGLRRTEVVRRTGRGKKKQTLTPVDATTKLPDGSELSGVDDLRKHLLTKKKKRFARALTSKMLSYALGRSLELGDQPTVDRITVQFLASDCRLSKLIELIAIDETFRTN